MNLGQLLKSKRKELKLTQTDVANAIGVSTNTISKYERNIIENMGRSKVLKLSKLLGIPTIKFIDCTGTNEPLLPEDVFDGISQMPNRQTTREEFEREIYGLLSRNAHIKFTYSAWLYLSNKLLNNVVDLDENQKKQIASYLELFKQ